MKLSIITPIYNTPDDLLHRMIDSVINQNCDFNDIELVMYNDGGCEVPWLDTIAFPFQFTYLNNSNNQGPGVARQKSIEASSGNYIVFCDSDDYFLEDGLSKYFLSYNSYIAQENREPNIIYPDRQVVASAVDVDRWDDYPTAWPDNLHGLCIQKHFLAQNNICFLPQCFHEDGLFTLQCAYNNPTMAHIDSSTIVHKFRPGSISFFGDSRLYDVSLLISLEQLIKLFPSAWDDEGLDETSVVSEQLLSRLRSYHSLIGEDSIEMKEYTNLIANFIITCLWPRLPINAQEEIQNYNPDFKPFTAQEMEHIYNNSLFQALNVLCDMDKDTAIERYLLNTAELLMELYRNEPWVNSPKCSIVIPSYNNREERFMGLFKSLNAQICSSILHVILVNDGSTIWPGDSFIHENLHLSHEIITLPENRGVGIARQTGLDAVNTPYVCFMDADDALLNDTALWHMIHWLNVHQNDFGVMGWERGVTSHGPDGEKQYETFKGSFEEIQMLHGLMCRKEALEKNDIRFAPIQYVEDGLFVSTILLLGLKVSTLPILVYDHKEGHLTNNLYQEFGLYNDFNDLCNLIKHLMLRFAYDDNPEIEQKVQTFLLNLLLDIEYKWLQKDTDDYAHLDFLIGDPQTYWYITRYYVLTLLNSIPRKYLYDFVTNPDILVQSRVETVALATKFLLYSNLDEVILYHPFQDRIINYEELEHSTKNVIEKRYEYFSSKGHHIPHQLMKNFPWNYKTREEEE